MRGDTAVKLAASLEAAIRAGQVPTGARLPPVRDLAARLGRSPTTVASAYSALRARGLLTTGGRRGTFVSPRPEFARRPRAELRRGVRDLRSGNPDPALLPDLRPALDRLDGPPRLYGEDLHHAPLVEAARASFAADGIRVGPVCVTAGAMDGIERVLRLRLSPGDAVAVEDPGYFGVLDLLAGLGLPLVPVPVDDDGLRPAELASALERGARAVVLTPRAQNPTGAAVGPRRCRELTRVLRAHPDVLVIEDDHAGPIAGPAAASLGPGRPSWAIVRSVAKALGPDLRVAFVTGDDDTMQRLEEQQVLGARWVSHILQRIVAELLHRRDTVRRLARAERTYAERRQHLLEALEARGIAARGRSGLNVWIPVPEEGELLAGLLARGWAVAGGERFRMQSPPAIRVTISTLDRKDATRFADTLADLLAPPTRSVLT